jgi:hypothetical protein
VSVDMPKIEVHSCGKDRKDEDLKTVRILGVLSIGIRTRSRRCVLFEEDIGYRLRVRDINDSIILKGIGRFTHI